MPYALFKKTELCLYTNPDYATSKNQAKSFDIGVFARIFWKSFNAGFVLQAVRQFCRRRIPALFASIGVSLTPARPQQRFQLRRSVFPHNSPRLRRGSKNTPPARFTGIAVDTDLRFKSRDNPHQKLAFMGFDADFIRSSIRDSYKFILDSEVLVV